MGPSENNRQTRFYRLTRAGRKQLQAELQRWQQTAGHHCPVPGDQRGNTFMKLLRRFLARLLSLASRRRDNQRFPEEMEEHLSLQTEENLRSGMTAAEARRQARLKFGAVEAIHEQYYAEKSLPFLDSVVQDVRYSCRIPIKNWGQSSGGSHCAT